MRASAERVAARLGNLSFEHFRCDKLIDFRFGQSQQLEAYLSRVLAE